MYAHNRQSVTSVTRTALRLSDLLHLPPPCAILDRPDRRWATSRAAVTPQRKMDVWASEGGRANTGGSPSWATLALVGPNRVKNLSGVSELRDTVCPRLGRHGLWWENLCQVSVAWPRSFRNHVDRQSDMARNRAMMTLQAICPASAVGYAFRAEMPLWSQMASPWGPRTKEPWSSYSSGPLRGEDRTITPSAIKAESDP
jgi:hypothetical protein